ncbi:hypothetical protein WMC41_31065 (plasmid) [Shinella yambaruensis]|uniref:hypothetical protein n=1 Tax=Shinella TaxID=323620 RepID=UPI0025879942|nr:hypothetical protein [Shinella sp.]MCW5712369.1 hypothetical protein [Shinella sp.]
MNHLLASVLIVIASTANAGENPMWPTSLTWTCRFSSVIRCERSVDCETAAEEGELALDYRENRLTDQRGTVHPIKRHYVQTVAGSPIGSEVKIELNTNEVIWLSPADGSGVFSDNWIGAMLSPKAGVVVQELRPLVCRPTK